MTEVLRGDWLTQGPGRGRVRGGGRRARATRRTRSRSRPGTAALHGAAFAAGLGAGDELVTSALTFAASANCGAYLGATPRFADIDPDTLERERRHGRGAVPGARAPWCPVHFAGLPAPVAEIRAAVGDDVTLIEDAAHALGARTADGRPVGCCAHVGHGRRSRFHPVKPIDRRRGRHRHDARSEELRDRLRRCSATTASSATRRLRRTDEGGWYHEQHDARLQLPAHRRAQRARAARSCERLDEFVAAPQRGRRRATATGSAASTRSSCRPAAPDGRAARLPPVRDPRRDGAERAPRCTTALRERGHPRPGALPARLPAPWYYADRYGYERGLCPEAEAYYDGCLSLPCFPTLTEADQDRVIDAVEEAAA